jgi:hypothetical protein
LIFDFAFEYTIRKVQEIKKGFELNVTHQLLVFADDDNLLGKNFSITKKNIQALLDTCKEIGLELNSVETKYLLMSHNENAGQNNNTKIAIK